MAEAAGAKGTALDATAVTEDDAPPVVTQAHVDYLEQIADQEADAVTLAERSLKDLEKSLAERRKAAERAKNDLAEGRRQLERQEG